MYKYLGQKKGEVADLVTMARILQKMDREFKKLLPPPLQNQVSVARLTHDELVVVAASPAWAAKLRFLSSSLLTNLRRKNTYFQSINRLSVITQPKLEKPAPPNASYKRTFSTQVAELLEVTADGVGEGELSAALRRLASRHRAD